MTTQNAPRSGSGLRNPATVRLSDLPREVAALTGGPTRSYRHFYNLVLNGQLPAERDEESGRTWRVRREHVPVIAQLVGLTPEPGSAEADQPAGRVAA